MPSGCSISRRTDMRKRSPISPGRRRSIPTQAGAFNFLSRCQWPLRRFDEALANGRKAHGLAPENPDIIKNVGLILQKLERHEEALAWFDKALALRPDFPSALNDRCTTLFALRRIDEAFANIDRAIALDPECRRLSLEPRAVPASGRQFRRELAGARMGTEMRAGRLCRPEIHPAALVRRRADRGQDHPAAQR